MDRLVPSTLLLCLLLASGCLAASPSAPPAAPSQTTSAAPSSNAALSPPAALEPSAGGSAPLVMEGQTDLAACAYGPLVGECRFLGGSGNLHKLEGAGPLLRLRGNLTWDGGLPMQAVLLHGVNGTWTYSVGDPFAQGSASPLAIDFDLRGRQGPLALSVEQSNAAILPVAYAAADTPQPFRLAGTLAWG
jgi:hypothetical protein